MKNHQTKLFKNSKSEYGGRLLSTRVGRSQPRPIDTKNTMHLILRSEKATGEFRFTNPLHKPKIKKLIAKFSNRFGIKVIDFAIVCNHIHFHLQVRNRHTYKKFIRALTASIMMVVTGASRWKKSILGKFWDYRPFTRVVIGFKSFKNLKHYIELNQMEGIGYTKTEARFLLASQNRLKYNGPRR